MICLLRKQPHNDFHYRTWNWFCYNWGWMSQYQKKLHSSHFTNRFVLQYVFGFSASRIPAKDLAAEKSKRCCNTKQLVVKCCDASDDVQTCHTRNTGPMLKCMLACFDKCFLFEWQLTSEAFFFLFQTLPIIVYSIYYRVTWYISRSLLDRVFFHSIFIQKPFNLSLYYTQ